MIKILDVWEKRTVTDEHRVAEIVELYKSLGLSVKVEDYTDETCGSSCNDCLTETPEKYKVIYTRPSKDSDLDILGDLF